MGEIDFQEEWHEIMVNFAADDPRIKNVVSWLMGQGNHFEGDQNLYENMANAACRNYGLNPDADLDDIVEICEERLLEETYDQA